MTKVKRKKPTRPYDYRARVLEPRGDKRLLENGQDDMSAVKTPGTIGPARIEAVLQMDDRVLPDKPESIKPVAIQDLMPDEKAGNEELEDTTTENAVASRNGATGKKVSVEPNTLAQFIEYAYSRKGQRLTLKSSVERKIADKTQLDDETHSHVLRLADADKLLAVPRQLLLISHAMRGVPRLKESVISFVTDVMLSHTMFSDPFVQDMLRSLPEGLSEAKALSKVAAYTPSADGATNQLKTTDLEELRHNALQLLVTWLAVNRGLSTDDLSALLFEVSWQRAVSALDNDTERLRALTDLGGGPGTGLACQGFRKRAIEAKSRQDKAQQEAAELRLKLTTVEGQLADTAERLGAAQAELHSLQVSASSELDALQRQQAIETTHLRYENEQLRGRLVKRLIDSVDMLEVGLSALRKDTPRIPVMMERAEHVVDALRAEIQELRTE